MPKSARLVLGQRPNFLRMLVDHLMCRDGRLDESLLERRAVRTLAARRSYQTALGTFIKCVKERALPMVKDVEIDGASSWFTASCCSDGSLTVILPLWFQKNFEVPSTEGLAATRLAATHTCLHSAAQLTLLNHCPIWQCSSSFCA